MTKQLNDILKMMEMKMDFFMIKQCLSAIGFETESMSMPSLKAEVETLLAHAELESESFTLVLA